MAKAPGSDTFEFEGREVAFESGDTVASALYRTGVRVFSRSFKYRRSRGLYCMTGDCPNCLVTINGEPAVRSCVTPARAGQTVSRGRGWPSTTHDVGSLLWFARRLMPVGFYYKALGRPSWLWTRAEPVVRGMTGIGPVDQSLRATDRELLHLHPDVLIIGGGPAGLSAALEAAKLGRSILLVDEARIGEKHVAPASRALVGRLHQAVLERPEVQIIEEGSAIGIYDGPQVPVDAPGHLTMVWPALVIVATGAMDRHEVFPNNDLPGVWLGRGAGILASRHGIRPGSRAVVITDSTQSRDLVAALRDVGTEIAAVVTPSTEGSGSEGYPTIEGRISRATGRRRVKAVVIEREGGGIVKINCDALVVASGFVPRDSLLRQSDGPHVRGAGEVISLGCSLAEAITSGQRAARNGALPAQTQPPPAFARRGFVCLCEDVESHDLERAWSEGFTSTEILKRYTTSSMGPCQGALCHDHLRSFVRTRSPEQNWLSAATTARPPARPLRVEDAAAGRRFDLQQQTALHDRHLAAGAIMERAGTWMRPESYGNEAAEYSAVREAVSVMDVGTLGKFLVGGPDAVRFLEHLYPCRIRDLAVGRVRYAVLLNEAGHVIDDGMICALDNGRYYLTFTSGGAEHAEAWLRYWIDALDLEVYIINETGSRGAINLAGPLARNVLARLTTNSVGNDAFPYLHARHLAIDGIPCIAIRLGFVGELSYELHHPSSRSGVLWDSILSAGAPDGIVPHGLNTLRLARLEKGHIIIGQDTDFDSGPRNLGLEFAIKLDKPTFVGKTAVIRNANTPLRQRLVPLRFDQTTPPAGSVLYHDHAPVGHLTSSGISPSLGCGVALGWLRARDGVFPTRIQSAEGAIGEIVPAPFYDPSGERLRA